jgi:hypothetical protein
VFPRGRRRRTFSVLQIRYGGCKGTLSVDPRLNGNKYELVIRDSMNKFTSDHDVLELCKYSAPRESSLVASLLISLSHQTTIEVFFISIDKTLFYLKIELFLTQTSSFCKTTITSGSSVPC